eukprot:3730686-Pyramimonas_sp.AAC.1
MISKEKDKTVFLTLCSCKSIVSRMLFGGQAPASGVPSEVSRSPCPSRTAQVWGPQSLAQAVPVLSRFPADPLHVAQGALSDSRGPAMSVNIGLSIPVGVVSVYLHASIGLAGANDDLLA